MINDGDNIIEQERNKNRTDGRRRRSGNRKCLSMKMTGAVIAHPSLALSSLFRADIRVHCHTNWTSS